MTKCKLCDRKAVVRLEYANMSLCREHFLEYFKRRVRKSRKSTFRRYPRSVNSLNSSQII